MDPATAKIVAQAVLSQITDEEKRQRLIIGIIIFVVVFVLILAAPILLITSAWDKVKEFFGWETEEEMKSSPQYSIICDMKNQSGYTLETIETSEMTFNGSLPMPVNGAVVTSEFGTRVHPITKKTSFHTGIDLAGAWHSPIMSVDDGEVVYSGVQTGYGNCIEIKHTTPEGSYYYSFYAHLATKNVSEGQTVQRGTVIATQGGDPKRDPNPRI